MYYCDGKAELSSVIPSEIFLVCWFGAREKFLIISVEKNCVAYYLIFLWKHQDYGLESLKEQHLF